MSSYSADDRSDWTEGEYLREIARLTRQQKDLGWQAIHEGIIDPERDIDAELAAQISDLEDELYILQHPDMFAPINANTKEAA